jgi:outer membrane protein assembly factor BamE (lipoprotein component of BamABCDE complex)
MRHSLALFALLLIARAAAAVECATEFADRFTSARFDRVAVGMTLAEVADLLGAELASEWRDSQETWIYLDGDGPAAPSVQFRGDVVSFVHGTDRVRRGAGRADVERALGKPTRIEPASRTGRVHFSAPGSCDEYDARFVTFGPGERVEAKSAIDRAPRSAFAGESDPARRVAATPSDPCTEFGPDFTEAGFAAVTEGMTRSEVDALLGLAWSASTRNDPETWAWGDPAEVAWIERDRDERLARGETVRLESPFPIVYFRGGRVNSWSGTEEIRPGMDAAAVEAALGKPETIGPEGSRTTLRYAKPRACDTFSDRVVQLTDDHVTRKWSEPAAPVPAAASPVRD